MRISNKRKAALYAAIREPICNLRVERKFADTDYAIAQLEHEIWQRVRKALDIKGDRE